MGMRCNMIEVSHSHPPPSPPTHTHVVNPLLVVANTTRYCSEEHPMHLVPLTRSRAGLRPPLSAAPRSSGCCPIDRCRAAAATAPEIGPLHVGGCMPSDARNSGMLARNRSSRAPLGVRRGTGAARDLRCSGDIPSSSRTKAGLRVPSSASRTYELDTLMEPPPVCEGEGHVWEGGGGSMRQAVCTLMEPPPACGGRGSGGGGGRA